VDRLYQILYSRLPVAEEKRALLAFLDRQEALLSKQASGGKKLNVPEGWGVKPELASQIDKFYKTVYGRTPDRFEKAAFVQYLDKQQEKAAKARAAGADDEDDAAGGKKGESRQDAARAAAFLDLVHAVANSNEFLYRF
jgi:hypothetical protein